MKKLQTASAALLLLVASGSGVVYAQGRGRGEEKKEQPGRGVPPQEQQKRAEQEQQRAKDYKQHLDQQVHVVQQQTQQLQAQKRAAAYTAQQEYAARLQEQQRRVQVQRDYSRDPYVTTPHTYRYSVGNVSRETNQYGADILKQAVNNGYQQGYRAGGADRQDHWKSNYRNSIAYRDANYGYEGNYVDRDDYNYYFRQGFQRGYDDGYGNHMQYGTSSNGTIAILGAALAGILILKAIH